MRQLRQVVRVLVRYNMVVYATGISILAERGLRNDGGTAMIELGNEIDGLRGTIGNQDTLGGYSFLKGNELLQTAGLGFGIVGQ